jgi:hypothetical protein
MKNTHVKYAIASSPGNYQAAHKLIREEGFGRQHLTFPTIMAWEGTELIGLVGTRIHDHMIIAGPLVLKSGKVRVVTAMRLCEAYEAAMGSMGIKAYIISVEQGSILSRAFKRYYPDVEPYAIEDGSEFYSWRVRNYGQQSQRTGSISGGAGAPETTS